MMERDLFTGKLVKLVPTNVEKDVEEMAKWDRDSEYMRQLDFSPAIQYSSTLMKDFYESDSDHSVSFSIRTIEGNKMIGTIGLGGFDHSARSAWVGIGIGDAEYRGKGYGTESMVLILGYAFRALNLNRVNLDVFAYNKRAVRSYEKCGFKYEGTQREVVYKEDQRWDTIDMGILRSEWESLQTVLR